MAGRDDCNCGHSHNEVANIWDFVFITLLVIIAGGALMFQSCDSRDAREVVSHLE